jgi:hypothetical protein
MADAHTLVFNHESIHRTVEEIPGGIKSITTTDDPELIAVLHRHPTDMDARLDAGYMVRCWDPLFAELGARHEEIELQVTPMERGVEVTCTSEDPEVVKLIRAHAAKVSDMAERGPVAMREATPLPDDYAGQDDAAAKPTEAGAQQCPNADKTGQGCCRAGKGKCGAAGKGGCATMNETGDGQEKGCCNGGGRGYRGGR